MFPKIKTETFEKLKRITILRVFMESKNLVRIIGKKKLATKNAVILTIFIEICILNAYKKKNVLHYAGL